jgi:replicative DNA helicase
MEKDNKNTPYKRKKDIEVSFNPFDVGKIPPQAIDMEEAVLGAVMLEKGTILKVIEILTPECFYFDAHSRIFNACFLLMKDKKAIDILTVTNQLKKTSELEIVGGPYYISKLTNRVASSANIAFHAAIVYQKYLQRKMIEICTGAIRQAFEDGTEVDMLYDWLINELSLVSMKLSSLFNGAKQVKDVWQELRDDNATLLENEGVNGIPTGLTEIDELTGGWQKSDMIVIGARPGMGKTSFAMGIAKTAAMKFGKKIAFFSLEMSTKSLVKRMVSDESKMPLFRLTKQGLSEAEFYELENNMSKLMECDVYIDDTPALTLFAFKAKLRQMIMDLGIEMAVIDYLQLMKGESKFREQEISEISRGLKEIAKEFQIPIIALSQLNRTVESRGGDKRPKLSDLRESGAIEQDADLVAFIHRQEYYKEYTFADGSSTRGVAEFIVEKHRNGRLDTIRLKFDATTTKFSDYTTFETNKTLEQHALINFSEPKDTNEEHF